MPSQEFVVEPNVKLQCVPKFCCIGDTIYKSWCKRRCGRGIKSQGEMCLG